jgi:tyrosyl-tRNA synthetase
VRHNSEWLEPLDMEGILRLTSSSTVARMLERDDFADRYEHGRPISITEFLYPLLQGYDSVAVRADVELGGNDQRFNLLVGRDLQRAEGQDPQVALTMPLLVGTDGVHKMSQSLGNYVAITDPPGEMFGKLVRVPDELIAEYRRLTLDFFTDPAEAERVDRGLAETSLDPWGEKRRMAREVVDLYHGGGSGAAAEAEFDRVHKQGELPEEIRDVEVSKDAIVVRRKDALLLDRAALLTELGLAASRSEARRLFGQDGVRRDGAVVRDADVELAGAPEEVIADLLGSIWQVGKRRFARVTRVS